jgi:hypothetical protein
MNHRAPDRYASSPAAYAVVAVGLAAVVLGTYAVTTDWSPWLVGPVVFVCAPAAAAGIFTALNRLSAYREVRDHYDRRRDAAYVGEQLPGPAEVLADLDALRVRLTIPAPRNPKD